MLTVALAAVVVLIVNDGSGVFAGTWWKAGITLAIAAAVWWRRRFPSVSH